MDADSDEERLSEEYDSAYDARYDTAAGEGWDLGADRVYWRRRFLVLCAGVIALGVCAWLVPGVHSPSARAAARSRLSVAALNKRQALPAAAYGSAWLSPAPSMPPSTASAKLGDTKRAATAGHPSATKRLAKSPAASAAGTSRCARAGIVLSLFTSQASYPRGARPSFSVYAVSTRAAACTLSFGAGAVQVIVTRDGHPMWDSAACRPGPAKRTRFMLGVPQVLTLTWNPRAARPSGCGGALGALKAGEWGTFDAVAMSNGKASPVRVFSIAGLPAEGGPERLAHVLHLGDLHRGPGREAVG